MRRGGIRVGVGCDQVELSFTRPPQEVKVGGLVVFTELSVM